MRWEVLSTQPPLSSPAPSPGGEVLSWILCLPDTQKVLSTQLGPRPGVVWDLVSCSPAASDASMVTFSH